MKKKNDSINKNPLLSILQAVKKKYSHYCVKLMC